MYCSERKRFSNIFLSLLLAELDEARCCERQQFEASGEPASTSRLDSATPKQFGCDELAN
jgi:hypothetical protein